MLPCELEPPYAATVDTPDHREVGTHLECLIVAARFGQPAPVATVPLGPVIEHLITQWSPDWVDTWGTVYDFTLAVHQALWWDDQPSDYHPNIHRINPDEDSIGHELICLMAVGTFTNDDLVFAGDVLTNLVEWVKKMGWEY